MTTTTTRRIQIISDTLSDTLAGAKIAERRAQESLSAQALAGESTALLSATLDALREARAQIASVEAQLRLVAGLSA
jgi:ferritin-like metal-binding protein YciE